MSKVLVVDDEKEIQEVIKDLLTTDFYIDLIQLIMVSRVLLRQKKINMILLLLIIKCLLC